MGAPGRTKTWGRGGEGRGAQVADLRNGRRLLSGHSWHLTLSTLEVGQHFKGCQLVSDREGSIKRIMQKNPVTDPEISRILSAAPPVDLLLGC